MEKKMSEIWKQRNDDNFPHREDLMDLLHHFDTADETGYVHPTIKIKHEHNSTDKQTSNKTSGTVSESPSHSSSTASTASTEGSAEEPKRDHHLVARVHSLEKLVYKLIHFLLQANQSIYDIQTENLHLREDLHLTTKNTTNPSGFTNTVYGVRREPKRNKYIEPEFEDDNAFKKTLKKIREQHLENPHHNDIVWAIDKLEGRRGEDEWYTEEHSHVPHGVSEEHELRKSDEEEPAQEEHHGKPIQTSTGQIILGPDNYVDKLEKTESTKKERKVTYWE